MHLQEGDKNGVRMTLPCEMVHYELSRAIITEASMLLNKGNPATQIKHSPARLPLTVAALFQNCASANAVDCYPFNASFEQNRFTGWCGAQAFRQLALVELSDSKYTDLPLDPCGHHCEDTSSTGLERDKTCEHSV